LLLEVGIVVAVVNVTGLVRSPFLVALFVVTAIAGFAGGMTLVAWLACLAAMSLALPSLLVQSYRADLATTVQFGFLVILVGVVAGYSRSLVDSVHRGKDALSLRVKQLSELNNLLLGLHHTAERVSPEFEAQGAIDWTLERLEESLKPDMAAVFLCDTVNGSWNLAGTSGKALGDIELNPGRGLLGRAAQSRGPVMVENLDGGLGGGSRWGLYSPLRVRDELLGLLVAESATPPETPVDTGAFGEIAYATALAVDNAKWLKRIQTLAVEQERLRLARELHDHISQPMVYIGLELDRLVDQSSGRAVQKDLLSLRGDTRILVEEVREALVDLRTDVSEEQDVADVLSSYLERVRRRGKLAVSFQVQAETRLPILVEREFWRVAQEAVVNAEKHSMGTRVTVMWRCQDDGVLLEVTDDGIGMPSVLDGGGSSYGIVGMRERADAVGADLTISSEPGRGTAVRMRLRGAR
jgi:signal transduction histidine kinase